MKATLLFWLLLSGLTGAQVIETNLDTGVILLPVKDAATHEMLRAALRENDPVVRARTLAALAQIGDPADRPLIDKLLDDPVPAVREQAARALHPPVPTTVPPPDSADPAADLRQPSPGVQQLAADTVARRHLVALAPDLVVLLDSPDSVLRRHVCEALGQLRTDQSPALAKQLGRDPDPLVCHAAADALVAIHSAAGRAALIEWLRHERPLVRAEAARVLGQWSDPALATQLLAGLADLDPTVARAVAEALGRLGNPDSCPALQERLAQSPVSVQERIVWALGELRATNALSAVVTRLHAANEELEASAAVALGKIGDGQAVPALRKVLLEMKSHGPLVRQRCWEALVRLGDRGSAKRAGQFLTEKLVPPPPGGAPEWMYDSDATRIAALRYLDFLGDAKVIEPLVTQIKDLPEYGLRVALAETMTKLTGRRYRAEFTMDARRYFLESLGAGDVPPAPPPPGIVPAP